MAWLRGGLGGPGPPQNILKENYFIFKIHSITNYSIITVIVLKQSPTYIFIPEILPLVSMIL